MYGRQYICPFEFTTTTAIDVVEITPADDKTVGIKSIFLKVTSELQEAQEEWIEVEIQRGGTAMTSGSGGSAAAAGQQCASVDAASGFTFEAGNTTLATFTAGVTPFRDAFNVRIGAEIRFTPDEYIWVSQANGGIVVRLPTAPTDSIDVKGAVTVVELP